MRKTHAFVCFLADCVFVFWLFVGFFLFVCFFNFGRGGGGGGGGIHVCHFFPLNAPMPSLLNTELCMFCLGQL